MMKKASITSIAILLLLSTVVMAGSIPEDIMNGNQKAHFIGRVTSLSNDLVEITPSTIMMGNLEDGVVQVASFKSYYGTDEEPKVGDFIVAVLIDENTIDTSWVFKATSDDYQTLELISERYGMVVRYQDHINQGKYHEAQQRLDEDQNSNTSALPVSTDTTENTPKNNSRYTYPLIAVFTLFIVIRLLVARKRK